jgi:hypothetical protein
MTMMSLPVPFVALSHGELSLGALVALWLVFCGAEIHRRLALAARREEFRKIQDDLASIRSAQQKKEKEELKVAAERKDRLELEKRCKQAPKDKELFAKHQQERQILDWVAANKNTNAKARADALKKTIAPQEMDALEQALKWDLPPVYNQEQWEVRCQELGILAPNWQNSLQSPNNNNIWTDTPFWKRKSVEGKAYWVKNNGHVYHGRRGIQKQPPFTCACCWYENVGTTGGPGEVDQVPSFKTVPSVCKKPKPQSSLQDALKKLVTSPTKKEEPSSSSPVQPVQGAQDSTTPAPQVPDATPVQLNKVTPPVKKEEPLSSSPVQPVQGALESTTPASQVPVATPVQLDKVTPPTNKKEHLSASPVQPVQGAQESTTPASQVPNATPPQFVPCQAALKEIQEHNKADANTGGESSTLASQVPNATPPQFVHCQAALKEIQKHNKTDVITRSSLLSAVKNNDAAPTKRNQHLSPSPVPPNNSGSDNKPTSTSNGIGSSATIDKTHALASPPNNSGSVNKPPVFGSGFGYSGFGFATAAASNSNGFGSSAAMEETPSSASPPNNSGSDNKPPVFGSGFGYSGFAAAAASTCNGFGSSATIEEIPALTIPPVHRVQKTSEPQKTEAQQKPTKPQEAVAQQKSEPLQTEAQQKPTKPQEAVAQQKTEPLQTEAQQKSTKPQVADAQQKSEPQTEAQQKSTKPQEADAQQKSGPPKMGGEFMTEIEDELDDLYFSKGSGIELRGRAERISEKIDMFFESIDKSRWMGRIQSAQLEIAQLLLKVNQQEASPRSE